MYWGSVQAVRPVGRLEVQLYPFMTTALEGDEGSASRSGRFLPRERPGTHFTGGWVGRRAGLDKSGKSRSHRDSIPGPSSPQLVAIQTTLPGPQQVQYILQNVRSQWLLLLLNETLLCLHITLHACLENKVCEVGKVTALHATQSHQGMGVQLHLFSTLELDEDEWLVSRFSRCARQERFWHPLNRGLGGPGTGPDILEKIKFSQIKIRKFPSNTPICYQGWLHVSTLQGRNMQISSSRRVYSLKTYS